MCKSQCELWVGVAVIVFALLSLKYAWATYITALAGLGIIIHSFTCKTCFAEPVAMKAASKRK